MHMGLAGLELHLLLLKHRLIKLLHVVRILQPGQNPIIELQRIEPTSNRLKRGDLSSIGRPGLHLFGLIGRHLLKEIHVVLLHVLVVFATHSSVLVDES